MNGSETQVMTSAGQTAASAPTSATAPLVVGAKKAGRDLLYLLGAFAMSILAFVVWVTGVSVTLSLLVLIIGVVVWFGTVYVFRWTVWLDRSLAGWLRGAPIEGVYRQSPTGTFGSRLRTVTTDPQTWKDFGWLVLNSIVGFAVTLIGLTATALVIGY